MLQVLKSKIFRVSAIVVALIGVYALLGFVIAPKLVRSALLKDIPQTIDATPSVGEIRINPFLFQLTVDDFALAGTGGEPLLGFKRLFVDFDLSSIWHRAYSFGAIDLTSPFVNAAVAPNGSLNLAQLQPKPSPKPKAEEKGEALPALRIGSLKILQGLLTYVDRSRPDAFAARLEPLNFELREFTTGVQGGQFTFTGSSKLGERIEWHGHLSAQPVESDGEFRIDGLHARTLWEYLQDQLNFVVDSGSINLASTYKFALKDAAAPGGGPQLLLDISKVDLSDFTVKPKGAPEGSREAGKHSAKDAKDSESAGTGDTWVSIPNLAVTGTTVDLARRHASVDLIALNGVKLATWLNADGSVNLMQLAAAPGNSKPSATVVPPTGSRPSTATVASANSVAPTGAPQSTATVAPPADSAPPAGAAPGTATVASADSSPPPDPTMPTATGAAPVSPTLTTAGSNASAAAAPPWTVDLRQFDVRDASISAEDRSVQPAIKLLFAPLSLQVNGASQDMTKPVSVTLDTRVNEKGSLNVEGQVVPQPATADLNLKVAAIDLSEAQPYIARYSGMTLVAGKFNGEGKLHYGALNSAVAAPTAGRTTAGNRQVKSAAPPPSSTLQFSGNINVEKLHTVDDALHDDFVNWDRLDILGLNYSQAPDRLDIDRIVAKRLYARAIIESDASMNVKRVLTAPGSARPAPAAVPPAAAVAVKASEPATAPPMKRGKGRKKTARANRAPAAATTYMPMSIKKIQVENSQINFTDLSVKPNFSAGIQKLNGSIVGLSSKPNSRATVDLTGAVDEFSPVSIAGEVNVLGPLFTDLKMSFRNISLAVFNPYSGKFAGYNITKGKLTTEFHYRVDGRKLDAQHHIVIEQLEFGDKTESKDAVSLPLKLAVSLLKDRHGVIDLELPVNGSLDDPQFHVGAIIWKVLVNLLEKAVTAPFALLGSLFGGGADIQYIEFQPGVGTLDPAAADKVKAVAKALTERPQLNIDVPLGVVPSVDGPALVDAQFKAHIAAAQAAKGSSKKAGAAAAPAAFDQIDPAAQLALLTRVYTQDVGGEPKFPDEVTSIKSKPEATAAKIDFLKKGIVEHISVGQGELEALAQQRAKSLQEVLLLDSHVEAERVFVVANDKATAKDGVVRLELSLK